MQEGKVYRVQDAVLRNCIHNRSMVEHHGYLWVFERRAPGVRDIATMRSVATSYTAHGFWRVDELEELEDDAGG